jgi:hypothetical protein
MSIQKAIFRIFKIVLGNQSTHLFGPGGYRDRIYRTHTSAEKLRIEMCFI